MILPVFKMEGDSGCEFSHSRHTIFQLWADFVVAKAYWQAKRIPSLNTMKQSFMSAARKRSLQTRRQSSVILTNTVERSMIWHISISKWLVEWILYNTLRIHREDSKGSVTTWWTSLWLFNGRGSGTREEEGDTSPWEKGEPDGQNEQALTLGFQSKWSAERSGWRSLWYSMWCRKRLRAEMDLGSNPSHSLTGCVTLRITELS